MKCHKNLGFTMIEVALFLALSGFLMIGIIVGANASISRQRYNDSVNSFADYIRGIYTDVLNVSNDKNPENADEEAGRTPSAVYGKLISFGECEDNAGTNCSKNTIYVYDIVGTAVSSAAVKGNRAIDMLKATVANGGVQVNIFDKTDCIGAVNCNNKYYRMAAYDVPWDGAVGEAAENGRRYRGAILVVRSPSTGSIRTYVYTYPPNEAEKYNFHIQASSLGAYKNFADLLELVSEKELTICIDSHDNTYNNRRGIIISERASNSSSIKITELDFPEEGESTPRCAGRSLGY